MSLAVLARTPSRRLRPGVRRALMTGASIVMHTVVLGSMILLASSEDHPLPTPPPPIIHLEIERPPLDLPPQPRPPVPRPNPPVEPIQPTAERVIPTPERPTPTITPDPKPAPTSQPISPPTPQPTPQAPPRSAPLAPPAPLPAPARAPAPIPAPVPAPPAAAQRAAPAPSPVLPIRPRKKDEDVARDGLPSTPAPRLAAPAPGGAPPAAASGVDGVSDAWRVAPEGQAGRNARALRVSPAGCPSTPVLRPGERSICDDRFSAGAARGADRPISGTGNADRDARFAREGAREMQRYEMQRRPLSGGTGVVGPADCVGSNFGTGCAGAHLRDVTGVDMRQGARSTVNEGERRPPDDD